MSLAAMCSSVTSNDPGPPRLLAKNSSQVFLSSFIPRDRSGRGTSNITMSSAWCATAPSRSLARTAAAQSSTNRRISCSLLVLHGCLGGHGGLWLRPGFRIYEHTVCAVSPGVKDAFNFRQV